MKELKKKERLQFGPLLDKFIKEQKEPTINLIKRDFGNILYVQDIDDVFNESIDALIENVINGKINIYEIPLKAYFRKICRNKCNDKVRKMEKVERVDLEDLRTDDNGQYYIYSGAPFADNTIDSVISTYKTPTGAGNFFKEIASDKDIMSKAINKLDNLCKEILMTHYSDGCRWSDVADICGYTSAESAKVTGMRCRKKLKDLFISLKKEHYA